MTCRRLYEASTIGPVLVPQARLQPQSPDFADTRLIGGLGISKTQGFADNKKKGINN